MPGSTEAPGEVRCRQCHQYVPWQNGHVAPHDVRPGSPCTGSHASAPPPRVRTAENDADAPVDLGVVPMPTVDENARPYGGGDPKPGIRYGDEYERTRATSAADALSRSSLGQHVQSTLVRPARCPTCDSPDPARHPAVQSEGEVQVCSDPWHQAPEPERPAEQPRATRRESLVPLVASVIDRKVGGLFSGDTRHQFCDEIASEVVDAILDVLDVEGDRAPE